MTSEEEDRLETLKRLRDKDIEPYPHYFERTHRIHELVEDFEGLEEADLPEQSLRISGRVKEVRNFGDLIFLDLEGEHDQVQLKVDDEKALETAEHIHRGDIVGVEGVLIYTNKEEFSLDVDHIEMLAKALNPIPSPYYGLEDQEKKYRQRSLHLIDSQEARDRFRKRSDIIRLMREFLQNNDFIEVETPIIQPIYGGASAKPFTTHIEDKDMEAYLRIAPELYHKRLIVGGYERVFEIGKNFRNESIDTTHNPEYTAMESYEAYADYEDVMERTENMIEHIVENLYGTTEVDYKGTTIDYSTPWRRMTMKEALRELGGIDVDELSDEEIQQLMQDHDAELDSSYERGLAIAELFEELVEEDLVQPTFIIDHPKETTPLCKLHREKEGHIERFEGFIGGMEIANAYTELRDPIQQEDFFKEEERRGDEGEEEAHEMDEDFIEALKYGMPPTGGLGIGIDRLVMLLTDAESIRDVILFPMMK